MNAIASTLGVLIFVVSVFMFFSPRAMKAFVKEVGKFRDKNRLVFVGLNLVVAIYILLNAFGYYLDVLNLMLGLIFLIRGLVYGAILGTSQGYSEWVSKNWALAGFLGLAVGFAVFYLGMTEAYLGAYGMV